MLLMSFRKIVFPSICGAFGGAESVTMGRGMVVIKVPGRLPCSIDPQDLPPPDKWNSFMLADAVQAHEQRKERRAS